MLWIFEMSFIMFSAILQKYFQRRCLQKTKGNEERENEEKEGSLNFKELTKKYEEMKKKNENILKKTHEKKHCKRGVISYWE